MGTRVKTDDRGTSSVRFTFIGRNDGLNFNVITDKENTTAGQRGSKVKRGRASKRTLRISLEFAVPSLARRGSRERVTILRRCSMNRIGDIY